jgi:hypothetical protein
MFPNYHWHKLFREMAYDDSQGFQLVREPVAQYLCRAWNARMTVDRQVAEFDLIFCMEVSVEAKGVSSSRNLRESLVHLDLRNP